MRRALALVTAACFAAALAAYSGDQAQPTAPETSWAASAALERRRLCAPSAGRVCWVARRMWGVALDCCAAAVA